jgi:peptide/nickel transport system permease protein
MFSYVLRRVSQTIIVLLMVTFFSFLLLYLLPGDPVAAIVGDGATQQQYDEAYHYMGFDKPFLVRYVNWLGNVIQGDFGMSYKYNRPVADILAKRVPVTFTLAFVSLFLSTFFGVILGVITAVNRGNWKDSLVTGLANLGTCMPLFWLALVLIMIFSIKLRWLPSVGFTWPWDDFGKSIKQMIMPIVCLGVGNLATMTRQTRSSMLEIIRQDYIRTARSKGLKENRVIYGHALRNSMVTIVTLMGMKIGAMIGNSVFIETVFKVPGIGELTVFSVNSKDFFMLQACVLIIALVFTISNLVVDLLYGYIDPRIRVE